ncbi:hypothetical protein ASZ90_019645 [hydrocarbon metagenome]|uniref:Uncharacterized protein n=1 Tax=hydrocarbon metagenome TaxID=938273 RepID=A0A0W8E2V6_9ZZZZ
MRGIRIKEPYKSGIRYQPFHNKQFRKGGLKNKNIKLAAAGEKIDYPLCNI